MAELIHLLCLLLLQTILFPIHFKACSPGAAEPQPFTRGFSNPLSIDGNCCIAVHANYSGRTVLLSMIFHVFFYFVSIWAALLIALFLKSGVCHYQLHLP